MKVEVLQPNIIQELAKIFGDVYTGSQLTSLLEKSSLPIGVVNWTKWRRLEDIFLEYQDQHQCSNQIMRFIQVATDPVLFINNESCLYEILESVNTVLAFAGYFIDDHNQIKITSSVETISQAKQRANELKCLLSSRNIHPDVLKFCKPELINENYFHAVLEATKSVSEKVRLISGLQSDGSELIDETFSLKKPLLAINSLQTPSERSEHTGLANLIKGIFSMFRNPTAHSPKVNWVISKEDATDLMTTLSFIHRKLDKAIKVPYST